MTASYRLLSANSSIAQLLTTLNCTDQSVQACAHNAAQAVGHSDLHEGSSHPSRKQEQQEYAGQGLHVSGLRQRQILTCCAMFDCQGSSVLLALAWQASFQVSFRRTGNRHCTSTIVTSRPECADAAQQYLPVKKTALFCAASRREITHNRSDPRDNKQCAQAEVISVSQICSHKAEVQQHAAVFSLYEVLRIEIFY